VRTRKSRSPDGLEWKISVHRFRLPAWYQSQFDPWDDDAQLSMVVIGYVFVAPIMWFLLPLARMLVELPVAMLGSVGSDSRWIEARTTWPAENTILWRVDRECAAAAADHIATHLRAGYENLTPASAEIVAMTPPPGLKDLG
jgi:hypothetical protein